jgi:hypothetical protein
MTIALVPGTCSPPCHTREDTTPGPAPGTSCRRSAPSRSLATFPRALHLCHNAVHPDGLAKAGQSVLHMCTFNTIWHLAGNHASHTAHTPGWPDSTLEACSRRPPPLRSPCNTTHRTDTAHRRGSHTQPATPSTPCANSSASNAGCSWASAGP